MKLPLSLNYKYGKFIIDEYTYDLRLESELSDLQSWYANPFRAGNELQDKQNIAMKCLICKARVGSIPSYGSTNDRKKKKQDFGWCFLMVHTANAVYCPARRWCLQLVQKV